MMEAGLREKLGHLPNKPGAYMMKDEQGNVIYVGKAVSLRKRVRSYFQKGQAHAPKVLVMLAKVRDVDWLVTDSEVEALMLECNLIKEHRPRYNVRLRDDKHYPYLCLTVSEAFPRVVVTRRSKQDGNRYFGPYADGSAVRESLGLARKTFRIRSCNKKLAGDEKDRPCLNHHLGQCHSPCSGGISRDEYAGLVRDTCRFLEGRGESLAARLEREMSAAADDLDFERAGRLRDQVGSIRKLIAKQKVISTSEGDRDVISIVAEGGWACSQLLFIRSGKLVGQGHFFLDGVTDETMEVSLGQFIKQHYRHAGYVPKEILVSHMPVERNVLEEWLSLRRGSRVKLAQPRRGEKRKLVEMAAENAALVALRERSRQADETDGRSLEALREVLNLPAPPARIEAYDISNIQGRQAVASMVVFQDGVAAKSRYRRFKIKTVEQPDDCAMIREALKRRLSRAGAGDPKFLPIPELILIDGGRGQLNAALEAISAAEESGVRSQESEESNQSPTSGPDRRVAVSPRLPVASLAKRLEEIYTPWSTEPILLPRESPALRLLQRIRDEAHRFALLYHRKLREKGTRTSVLDGIHGIGSRRRRALIRKFGSVAGVRRASLEELLSVREMTRSTAEAVYEAFHP